MQDNFIFIVGCGHSGTTILQKILGNHKSIYGIPYETGLFMHTDTVVKEQLSRYGRARGRKKWVCEKTPTHVYWIDSMYKYTRHPKIIVIIRDGRDVVASLKKRGGSLEGAVDRWVKDNQEWMASPHRHEFHVLKYEDFVRDPPHELRRICDFIQEEYDDGMLTYGKQSIQLPEDFFEGLINGPKHSVLRQYQVNQDIYDGSGRHVRDLTHEDKEHLSNNEAFVRVMTSLGY